MARLYARSSKGRTPLLSSPVRLTRSKANTEDNNTSDLSSFSASSLETVLEPAFTRSQNPHWKRYSQRGRKSVRLEKSGRSLRTPVNSTTQEDDEEEADDEEDDDADDAEEPDLFAPSYALKAHLTGRSNVKDLSPLEYEDNLIGNSDDDDDEIYEGVNEISDYEDDVREEALEAFELEEIVAYQSDEDGDPDIFLHHIDGMSELGFGPDADAAEELSTSSTSSEDMTEIMRKRRVHWQSDLEIPKLLAGSDSPPLTRPLLAFALHETHNVNDEKNIRSSTLQQGQAQSPFRSQGGFFEDPYDSDATEEDLPSEAHANPTSLEQNSFENEERENQTGTRSKKSGKKASRQRGPRPGFFQVDKDKPWALLDPLGKKIVLLPAPETDRHDWLHERIGHTPVTSPNASPTTPLAHLIEESDQSVTSSQENVETVLNGAQADVMIAGLALAQAVGVDRGQATGPAEAFYPPLGFQVVDDYIVEPDDATAFDNFSDISNEADLPIPIDNFIKFDDEDDSDPDDSPTSPTIYMPPLHELSGNRNIDDQFAHLNNRNVTAFRRSADPTFAAMNRLDSYSHDIPIAQPTTPGRKRKAMNLPYQDPLYEGVTPVQRILIDTTKRRRVLT